MRPMVPNDSWSDNVTDGSAVADELDFAVAEGIPAGVEVPAAAEEPENEPTNFSPAWQQERNDAREVHQGRADHAARWNAWYAHIAENTHRGDGAWWTHGYAHHGYGGWSGAWMSYTQQNTHHGNGGWWQSSYEDPHYDWPSA